MRNISWYIISEIFSKIYHYFHNKLSENSHNFFAFWFSPGIFYHYEAIPKNNPAKSGGVFSIIIICRKV